MTACAYTDELEDKYLACGLSKSPECTEIVLRMDEREDRRKRLMEKQAKRGECPPQATCYYGYEDMKAILDAYGRGH